MTTLTPNGVDDTDQLGQAVGDALAGNGLPWVTGPSGDQQAVVRIPAARKAWRFGLYAIPSNVRLVVDAGAVLQLPRTVTDPTNVPNQQRAAMFTAGGGQPGASHYQNVSIVAAGSRRSVLKAKHAALTGTDTTGMFTVNLDPGVALCSNVAVFLDAANVSYLELGGIFFVQNDTNQAKGKFVPWPTSDVAAVSLRADRTSPVAGPFLQPDHVTVTDVACYGAPRGYGWAQINAGTDITIDRVSQVGGTALRLETDGSMGRRGVPDRGATLDRLTASDILCVNGNRAVSLAPHAQHNGQVRVDQVRAVSCYQGVVANFDGTIPKAARGRFDDAEITNLTVEGGMTAQVKDDTHLWAVGESDCPVYVAGPVAHDWAPRIDTPTVSGTFTAG